MTLRTAIAFSPTTIKHESEEEGVLQFRLCTKEGCIFSQKLCWGNSPSAFWVCHFPKNSLQLKMNPPDLEAAGSQGLDLCDHHHGACSSPHTHAPCVFSRKDNNWRSKGQFLLVLMSVLAVTALEPKDWQGTHLSTPTLLEKHPKALMLLTLHTKNGPAMLTEVVLGVVGYGDKTGLRGTQSAMACLEK